MPTTMNCPGCQTPLRLREDMAGKKIKCPRCAHVVAIPAAAAETLEEVESLEEITEAPSALKSKAKVKAKQIVEDDDDAPIDKRSKYKPCPRCGEVGAKRVTWTPWGSFYGPTLFTHVRCPECGYRYNGCSGRSNLIPAILFVTIPLVLILGIIGFVVWLVIQKGYFA